MSTKDATMSAKDATMSAKDATMSAKDATRSAKDATRSAKDATRSSKGRDHERQGRDHERQTILAAVLLVASCRVVTHTAQQYIDSVRLPVLLCPLGRGDAHLQRGRRRPGGPDIAARAARSVAAAR